MATLSLLSQSGLNKEKLRQRCDLHRSGSHSVSERKAPEPQSEKQNESEVKRKSAVTFGSALFFLVAGTRLSYISFRIDVIWGLYKEKPRQRCDLRRSGSHSVSERKAPEPQSEKQNESEVKRKSAVTFVTALFFLVAGTRLERASVS